MRETLQLALEQFAAPGLAVDLGCGAGGDVAELLRRGWRVLAIDAEEEAIRRLEARKDLGPDEHARLETQVARFEDATWPSADLVNSSWALPFCHPASFPAVWARIVTSLATGGRFSGQLFGDRDGWREDRDLTFLSRAEVDELLRGFEAEHLDEVEEDGRTALGQAKHWHVFHVVARKL